MASSREFLDFVMDQLHGLGELRSRMMFGEYGLYCDDLFFAIVAEESLWLKVDDENRPRFEARDMGPFAPEGYDSVMQYYEVPLDVLEDPSQLRDWAGGAVDVARRKPKRKKKK